jgi:hypothetical protein
VYGPRLNEYSNAIQFAGFSGMVLVYFVLVRRRLRSLGLSAFEKLVRRPGPACLINDPERHFSLLQHSIPPPSTLLPSRELPEGTVT